MARMIGFFSVRLMLLLFLVMLPFGKTKSHLHMVVVGCNWLIVPPIW